MRDTSSHPCVDTIRRAELTPACSTVVGQRAGRTRLAPWNFGPLINLPIFDYGRRRANVAVADALAGHRYLAEQVAAQQRGMLAQQQIAELARTRYNEGVVGCLEVLDAERNLFAAGQALLQLRRAEVDTLVALYIALGGGTIE